MKKLAYVLAENAETVILPGNLIELDFSGHPAETLKMMQMEFTLDKAQKVKVQVNTPANMRVWVDGTFCFGREGGKMVPAFHRALINQLCELDLGVGKHTLLIGVAPANAGAGGRAEGAIAHGEQHFLLG